MRCCHEEPSCLRKPRIKEKQVCAEDRCIIISFSTGCKDLNFYVWALSVIGLGNAIRSSVRGAPGSAARSCPVNCINMKCRCIIDETIATFTVRVHVCARTGRMYNARVRECARTPVTASNTFLCAFSHNSAVYDDLFLPFCLVLDYLGTYACFLFLCVEFYIYISGCNETVTAACCFICTGMLVCFMWNSVVCVCVRGGFEERQNF